jgi:hypothetical protein
LQGGFAKLYKVSNGGAMTTLKRIFAAALLILGTSIAQATVINVDFSDVITPVYPGEVFNPIESKGFQIEGIGPKVSGSSSGVYLETFAGGSMFMSRIDGASFDLLQMDIFVDDPTDSLRGWYYASYANSFAITARDSGNNIIASIDISWMDATGWRTIQFDSSWSNIATLELGMLDNCCNEVAFGEFNNITVNVVPIPSAVWLFGSALAGLGWMRCKKTF